MFEENSRTGCLTTLLEQEVEYENYACGDSLGTMVAVQMRMYLFRRHYYRHLEPQLAVQDSSSRVLGLSSVGIEHLGLVAGDSLTLSARHRRRHSMHQEFYI